MFNFRYATYINSGLFPYMRFAKKREAQSPVMSDGLKEITISAPNFFLSIQRVLGSIRVVICSLNQEKVFEECSEQFAYDILSLYQNPLPEYSFWQNRDGSDTTLIIKTPTHQWGVIRLDSGPGAVSLLPEIAVRQKLHGLHHIHGRLRIGDFGDCWKLQSHSLWIRKGHMMLVLKDRSNFWKMVGLNSETYGTDSPQSLTTRSIAYPLQYETVESMLYHWWKRFKGELTIIA